MKEFPVKQMKTLLLAAATSALMLASPALLAHSDEYLETQKAPNGGQLRMASIYHFELVVARDSKEATESPVVVYVTDHAGTKIPTTGASGVATILAGKRKTSITLVPDGDNRLKGVGKYISAPDMKVVVSITLAGKAAEQARFTPLAVARNGHTDHKH
jgi:hypothetical protein